MFNLSLPWWEFIFRAALVYFFLLGILRLTGRRQVGQLSTFDFITLLILSNAVQNSMSGGDNSVSGGIILAGTLILLNWVIAYFTYKYKWFAKTVDGVPEVLIHDGRIVFSAIRRELITEDELMGALRKNGLEKISDVHIAIIEPSGAISVVAKK